MSANQEPDEALGRAVPRAGGAASREHDRDAEDETADDDGYRLEGTVVRRDDTERGQRGEADGVDGNDDEEGDESAALFCRKTSRSMPVTQKRPRCMMAPRAAPTTRPEASISVLKYEGLVNDFQAPYRNPTGLSSHSRHICLSCRG